MPWCQRGACGGTRTQTAPVSDRARPVLSPVHPRRGGSLFLSLAERTRRCLSKEGLCYVRAGVDERCNSNTTNSHASATKASLPFTILASDLLKRLSRCSSRSLPIAGGSCVPSCHSTYFLRLLRRCVSATPAEGRRYSFPQHYSYCNRTPQLLPDLLPFLHTTRGLGGTVSAGLLAT